MDDDDVPALSAETFAALQEFYAEQQKRHEIITKLDAEGQLKNIFFDENWQLSQFWYDDATIDALVRVIERTVPNGGLVALISCPTLFVPVKTKLGEKITVKMDDDDVPALSAETFAALQEFYAEQQKRHEIITKLDAEGQLKNIFFDENWQLSQFWYDDATIDALVRVIERTVPNGGLVALISCPTLFVPVKTKLGEKITVSLLEYDKRFEVHAPDFIFYDYNYPDRLPPNIEQYDLVVADPPFLSEECLTKTSQTIRLLAKDKIVLCTGATMKEHVDRLLALNICEFQPHHRNNLANEFSCYANFNLDSILIKSDVNTTR